MITRTKVCGIRDERDLGIAVDAGADAIGLICGTTHLSEDALTPDEARRHARLTPPFVSTVLVTHIEDAREVLGLADYVGADTIQLHGLVTSETLAQVLAKAQGRRVFKAVHVVGEEAIEAALELADLCDAILLDSRTTTRLGGTGRTHDWSISRRITNALRDRGLPVILAGGLRPDNVSQAIQAVRPFAVDVNSGVENSQGEKAATRCAAFVSRARESLDRPPMPAAPLQ